MLAVHVYGKNNINFIVRLSTGVRTLLQMYFLNLLICRMSVLNITQGDPIVITAYLV